MKKFSTQETILILAVAFLIDAADFVITIFLLDLLGAGEFVKAGFTFAAWAIIGLCFKMKGVPKEAWLVFNAGLGVKAIPFINGLIPLTPFIVIAINRANKQSLFVQLNSL